jgi:hypothetical protein
LFRNKNLGDIFILSPIAEIVGFSVFDKDDQEQKTTGEEPLQFEP